MQDTHRTVLCISVFRLEYKLHFLSEKLIACLINYWCIFAVLHDSFVIVVVFHLQHNEKCCFCISVLDYSFN